VHLLVDIFIAPSSYKLISYGKWERLHLSFTLTKPHKLLAQKRSGGLLCNKIVTIYVSSFQSPFMLTHPLVLWPKNGKCPLFFWCMYGNVATYAGYIGHHVPHNRYTKFSLQPYTRGVKPFSGTLCIQHLQLTFLRAVWNPVSAPHKTKSNITVQPSLHNFKEKNKYRGVVTSVLPPSVWTLQFDNWWGTFWWYASNAAVGHPKFLVLGCNATEMWYPW